MHIYNFCCNFVVDFEQNTTMSVPSNPAILVSFINMKLRDEYPSLEALCEDLELNIDELCRTLRDAGYEYSEEHKRFW